MEKILRISNIWRDWIFKQNGKKSPDIPAGFFIVVFVSNISFIITEDSTIRNLQNLQADEYAKIGEVIRVLQPNVCASYVKRMFDVCSIVTNFPEPWPRLANTRLTFRTFRLLEPEKIRSTWEVLTQTHYQSSKKIKVQQEVRIKNDQVLPVAVFLQRKRWVLEYFLLNFDFLAW